MNFKPILFSTPMVQAILEDRKLQTRRVIKPQPSIMTDNSHFNYNGEYYLTREQLTEKAKIQKDDILWVRETWQYNDDLQDPYLYKQQELEELKPEYFKRLKWKPSIFMPKDACRIFLEVTNVRVERLQDISEEDIVSEGIFLDDNDIPKKSKWTPELVMSRALQKEWKSLWQHINGKESWNANPWVWVYDFKRTEKPAQFL